MNQFLLLLFSLLLSACASRQAASVGTFGVLVRSGVLTRDLCPDVPEGQACLMTQPQAESYCAAQGQHLPTSREFAAYSMGLGAQGILEVDRVSRVSGAPAQYYLVDSVNPNGARDSFYFSHAGFDVARSVVGSEHLWTASIVPTRPGYAHVFYGEWGGGGGKPAEHARSFRNAVRCLPN